MEDLMDAGHGGRGRLIPAAELERWLQQLAAARQRVDLARTADSDSSVDPIDELERSFEELAVAGEELRVQSDEIAAARDEIERERERYRLLFEQAPIAYLVTDGDGMIREANQAAAELFATPSAYLRGKPLAIFIPASARSTFRRSLIELRGRRVRSPLVLRVAPRFGVPSLVNASVGVVRDREGAVRELRWLLVDDTARRLASPDPNAQVEEIEARVALQSAELHRALENAEQRCLESERERLTAERNDAAKTELLAMVSHESRTPLAAIAGYAELLAMGVHGELNPAQESDVSRIRRAGEHILSLLDDLLVYFRLGAGRLRVSHSPVRVAHAMASIAELIEPQAAARGIEFTVAPNDLHAVVEGDPERIRQIVLNLLTNALKYTATGGRVVLSWELLAEDAEITVRDTGCGIAAEYVDRIFEPFVQLESGSLPAAGFGLGLAISRELARAMGGDLDVRSVVGEGSEFRLRLPRCVAVD
jgi:PAS domain S-box-containing protein